jgi:hypothetical protein
MSRKYAGYGLTPFGNKQVEVNEIHQPGFHGGYKVIDYTLHCANNPSACHGINQL